MIPGISNKVLSSELKELEELSLIEREEFREPPPRVEYRLTKSGKSLIPLLHELAKWGNTNLAKKLEKEIQ